MKASPALVCRTAASLLALMLAAECIWLSLPQWLQPGVDRLPTGAALALAAVKHRANAEQAASIGAIRGDLWAQAAFTYSDLLWRPQRADATRANELAKTRTAITHALHQSPHNSDVWLLAGGLALRYPSPQPPTAIQALKMSYYTGPSDQEILPLRFSFAARSDFMDDIEMRQFIARDLRLLVARKQKSEITQAYLAASPAGKQFIEQTVKDIDPSAGTWLHAPEPPPLPN